MFQKKKVTVPRDNATERIDAVQLWEVRWRSRRGEYFGDTQPEMEAFPSQEKADRFAEASRSAFKLIRHTSGTTVTVTKASEH